MERALLSRTESGGFGVTRGLCLGSQEPLSTASFTMAGLVPDLQHILFWMSNSVELLYFIQQKCPLYMQSLEEELDATGMAVPLLPGGERPRAIPGERWPPEQRWVCVGGVPREGGDLLVGLTRCLSSVTRRRSPSPSFHAAPPCSAWGGPGDTGPSLHSVSPWPPAPPECTTNLRKEARCS